MRSQMDFDHIYKQMEESVAKVKPEDSLIYQIQETMEQSNEESAKITKKQNRITNVVQIATLVITALTFASTIVFGILGLRS